MQKTLNKELIVEQNQRLEEKKYVHEHHFIHSSKCHLTWMERVFGANNSTYWDLFENFTIQFRTPSSTICLFWELTKNASSKSHFPDMILKSQQKMSPYKNPHNYFNFQTWFSSKVNILDKHYFNYYWILSIPQLLHKFKSAFLRRMLSTYSLMETEIE